MYSTEYTDAGHVRMPPPCVHACVANRMKTSSHPSSSHAVRESRNPWSAHRTRAVLHFTMPAAPRCASFPHFRVTVCTKEGQRNTLVVWRTVRRSVGTQPCPRPGFLARQVVSRDCATLPGGTKLPVGSVGYEDTPLQRRALVLVNHTCNEFCNAELTDPIRTPPALAIPSGVESSTFSPVAAWSAEPLSARFAARG